MIVIERPHSNVQMYVAKDMGKKYHFVIPTIEVPCLYKIIQQDNDNLKILFIPNNCERYESDSLQVYNKVLHKNLIPLSRANGMEGVFYSANMNKVNCNNQTCSTKRNGTSSVSIGLQTMYSHQQHTSRYCMLPQSMPHLTTVKNHPLWLRHNILIAYEIICNVLESSEIWEDSHPFSSREGTILFDEGWFKRMDMRKDILNRLLLDDIPEDKYDLPLNKLFESCTIQQTGRLEFHRDPMNCPTMDWTLALHVPHADNKAICMSYLFYSRKCVGDYIRRMDSLHSFLADGKNCKLTKLCLTSMMETRGTIFNYQSTLFEHDVSLDKLAQEYENSAGHSCTEVQKFTGLICFKHGAAFDKMGYYSIFINFFLSLHYLGLATDIDDSISICIYFGLLCNGTSNLAATWNAIHDNLDFALKWCKDNNDSTRLFRLLIHLETERRKTDKTKKVLYGCCKLYRFQYANYGCEIVEEADMVHCYVKDFLTHNQEDNGKQGKRDVYEQHSELYQSMSHVKGIGPLSFNQFWHALCLCGVLPMKYIVYSKIAPNSGPAKLIQTFYPKCHSPEACLKKMHQVKGIITKLGMKKITDFFLENMLCELQRLRNKLDFVQRTTNDEQRSDAFLSDEFHAALITSLPTRNPDLYFKNPFTGTYQHLFRFDNNALVMRPSFLDNSITSSTTVKCEISYSQGHNEAIEIKWSGVYVKMSKVTPSDWFITGKNSND